MAITGPFPLPKVSRTIRLVAETMACVFAISSGTTCRSTLKPSPSSKRADSSA
jgi:hypothetical protein